MSEQAETSQANGEASATRHLLNFLLRRIRKIVISNTDRTQVYGLASFNNHNRIFKIGSRESKDWLKVSYNAQTARLPSDRIIERALDFIRSSATESDSQTESIYSRIAMTENAIYYDLASPDWKAVKISNNSVEMVDIGEDTPTFERHQTQRRQVNFIIEEGRDSLDELVKLLRIPESDQHIFKVHLVSMFLEKIQTPIIVLKGEAGSLKTTITGSVKRIVDPSGDDVSSFPNKRDDLILNLNNRYMPNFDNVSFIDHSLSDILSRAVTGQGISKRKLYSDSEEIIFSYRRKIALNGITFDLGAQDLLERCIVYETTAPSNRERITESEFNRRLNELLPSLLGHIFQTLSKVFGLHNVVEEEITDPPRMADFAVYGECISRALGYEKLSFVKNYRNKVNDSFMELIESQPLTLVIEHLMESRDEYENTVQNFYNEITGIALQQNINPNQRRFPAASNKVKPSIERIKPNLRRLGYDVNYYIYTRNDGRFPKNRHIIKLEKTSDQ